MAKKSTSMDKIQHRHSINSSNEYSRVIVIWTIFLSVHQQQAEISMVDDTQGSAPNSVIPSSHESATSLKLYVYDQ